MADLFFVPLEQRCPQSDGRVGTVLTTEGCLHRELDCRASDTQAQCLGREGRQVPFLMG